MRYLTVFLLVFLGNIKLFSQEWIARYNGPDNLNDGAQIVVLDNEGNVYVTGVSNYQQSFGDIVTIKYNPNGEIQWIARYNGPSNYDDYPTAMTIDSHGNVYVTGATGYPSGSNVEWDYVTIKYDSNGREKWVAIYDGPGSGIYDWDMATAIAVDNEGNVYVTGQSSGGSNTFFDFATIKYDSNGFVQWVRRYESEGWDQATAIGLDNYGNIYVTGGYNGGGETHYDYLTLKYNREGALIGAVLYSGPGLDFDFPFSLAIDNFNNVYVTGISYLSRFPGDPSITTIKYDTALRQQQIAIYRNGWEVRKIISDSLSNVYVIGSVSTDSGSDMVTIKYDASLNELWARVYGTNEDDHGVDIGVDIWGNVYITGIIQDELGISDYLTIKYDSTGELLWSARYDGFNDNDYPNSLVVDRESNVYVTGASFSPYTNYDYLTIKYSSLGKMEEFRKDLSDLEINHLTKGIIKVKYKIIKKGDYCLKLYSSLGNLIKVIDKGRKEKGNYEDYFNLSELPPGLYFLTLITNDKQITRKIIIF
uniref:T9SS type A sorting domain-containing protein n=1 Tax=candidate division WOR-3 bacterium TaxID=2052148 RepID=A0A7V5XYY6_UNCW3